MHKLVHYPKFRKFYTLLLIITYLLLSILPQYFFSLKLSEVDHFSKVQVEASKIALPTAPAPNIQPAISFVRHNTKLNTGISDSDPYTTEAEFSGEMKDFANLGVGWIRLDFRWRLIQSAGPSNYNWRLYDMLVKTATEYHIKVLGTLDYAPTWAAKVGCVNSAGCAPANSDEYANFAAMTTQRYQSQVNYWEIWNEENGNFWSPSPNIRDYASALIKSYASIKHVNPQAKVLLGGMSDGNNTAKHNIEAVSFLQGIYANGAGKAFDAVAYHPYTFPGTPLDINGSYNWSKLGRIHNVMVANNDSAKQIWVTEFGAPTNGPSEKDFINERAQAEQVSDIVAATADKPWVGPLFWYTYRDFGADTNDVNNFYGLRRYNGAPKAAYYTLQNILKKN
jgi:hypothetical protein